MRFGGRLALVPSCGVSVITRCPQGYSRLYITLIVGSELQHTTQHISYTNMDLTFQKNLSDLTLITSLKSINRELKQTTTTTATRTSSNKRFNEQNNGYARAL